MYKTIALTLCGLLCACGDSPDSTSERKQLTPPNDITLGDGDNYGSVCDRQDTQQITVDGQTYVFNVPTLCNSYLGIDKGDPPPDRVRTWDDRTEDNFDAPHVDVSSQNSTPNQR
jgi:hypothetical protein